MCESRYAQVRADMSGESKPSFVLPPLQDNPSGWGPVGVPDYFNGIPYQPFSKADKIGLVCSLLVHHRDRSDLIHLTQAANFTASAYQGRASELQHVLLMSRLKLD